MKYLETQLKGKVIEVNESHVIIKVKVSGKPCVGDPIVLTTAKFQSKKEEQWTKE